MPGSSRGGRERQGATATGIITNEHGHSHTEALREILAEAAEAAKQQENKGERCDAKAEKMTEELQCQSEEIDKLRADLKTAEDLLQEGNELFDHAWLKDDALRHDLAERNAAELLEAETEAHSWKATADELRQELVDAQKEAQAWKVEVADAQKETQAWKVEEMRVSQLLIDQKMEAVYAEWTRLESKWSNE